MPPRGSRGGRLSRGGAGGSFAAPYDFDPLLGKRRGGASDEGAPARRGGIEHQSSFAQFMNKKGDVIGRLM